jgi:signal transduction histidine kinase
MSDIEDAYFARDVARLRGLGLPPGLLGVLSLHWQGQLFDAEVAAAAAPASDEMTDPVHVELLAAEHALLRVKIGLGLPPCAVASRPKTRLARLIWQYACFSHSFWTDQHRAWRTLGQLLWLGLVVPRSGMLATTLFLIGHLAAIAGFGKLGHAVASAMYRYCASERWSAFAPSAFSRNIVFAAFPYTLLVSGELARLEEVRRDCQRRLPPDPYYTTIFLVSALYSAAYTGDVVRAEIFSVHLQELHVRGPMRRYQSVAQIAPFVPLAFRGYSHLIEKDFRAVVESHQPAKTDAVVNSQFYRMVALIALSIGQFDQASSCVALAIAYRKQSGSFHLWHEVDVLIRDLATRRVGFDPSQHRLFGVPMQFDSPVTLGTLLIDTINVLPASLSEGVEAFEDRVFELFKRHVNCPHAEMRSSPASLVDDHPQLRLGSRYIVLRGLDSERVPAVQRLLSTISPVLAIMISSAREMLAAKAENDRISREVVIARATQMLAHDVRQPFQMLRQGLDAIRAAANPDDVRRTVELLVPDMERVTATVEGLIADVMEIGASAVLQTERAAPEDLVACAVQDLLGARPLPRFQLEYEFAHAHQVLVDARKLRRVFANILLNAVQAIGVQGRLWFRTSEALEDERWFVEFAIGNTGSSIAPEDVPKLFDAFFTKGKDSGTGLGLAIAHRVVTAHGGRIWCVAVDGGVEFRFTLPCADGAWVPQAHRLPASSPPASDGFEALRSRSARHVAPMGPDTRNTLPGPGSPEVALVDDSRAFLPGWRAALGERVVLHFFTSPDAFWRAIDDDPGLFSRLSVVITDYRFSNSRETGASFADAIRSRSQHPPVLLTSCAVLSESELEASFDGVLAKGAISWASLVVLLAKPASERLRPGWAAPLRVCG